MEYLFYAAILIIILYFTISSRSTPSRIDYDDDYIPPAPDPTHIGKKPESKYDSLLKTNEWRNKR